jgi:hypothetical protein
MRGDEDRDADVLSAADVLQIYLDAAIYNFNAIPVVVKGLRGSCLVVVPGEGLEPSRPRGRRILSPLRLPIPPSRHQT